MLVAGKSAVHTLLNHNVFPPFDVRLRCPDNSRTLQRGSFSFTDCGCIVGYINVANVTAGLTARRPTLQVGGCFHERNLFGPANELSDRIGILFFSQSVPRILHAFLSYTLLQVRIVAFFGGKLYQPHKSSCEIQNYFVKEGQSPCCLETELQCHPSTHGSAG